MSGGADAAHSVSLPVFVDRTGWRRRPIVAAGVLLGAALLTGLILLLAGLFTGEPLPLPGWPDLAPKNQEQGQQVDSGRLGVPPGAPTSPTSGQPDAPTATPRPAATPPGSAPTGAPQPTVTERPGQGDDHRATPRPRPSKSPGKPT